MNYYFVTAYSHLLSLLSESIQAHWCPPCRSFTPELAAKYSEIVAAGHTLEIIFISSDHSEAECNEYFAEMPWKCLDFADRSRCEALKRRFVVKGIPTLVLLNGSGKMIARDGRSVIMTTPFEEIADLK
jgi:thiol-disulfide isomerase/thioredoxin